MPTFERPIVEKRKPDSTRPTMLRAIISPCTGCRNNIQVPTTPEESDSKRNVAGWPCPKVQLYQQKLRATREGDRSVNYSHPVFDDRLRGTNPVWPGISINGDPVGNNYAYIFVATFEDNVDNGWNPEWDTSKIRCRGPFLLASPERHWNLLGHAEQGDGAIIWLSNFYIDGANFKGFALEAAIWQTPTGYSRTTTSNITRTTSGAR